MNSIKNALCITFLLVLFYSAVNYSQQSDSSYLPLAVGNKWQYVGGAIDYLKIVSVTRDTVINNKKYYRLEGAINNWVRYDDSLKQIIIWAQNTDNLNADFNYGPNVDFNSYVFNYNNDSGNRTARISAEELGNALSRQRFIRCFLYVNPSAAFYVFEYSKGLGITEISNSYGTHSIEYNDLIRALINENGTSIRYSDSVRPQITLQPLLVTNKYNNLIQAIINHPYEYNSLNFIDTIKLESYYCNGTNTIHNNSVLAERNRYSKMCNFVIYLDSSLLRSGYEYYYRICAVDKGIVPEYSYKPDAGYYKLEYSPNYVNLWEKKSTNRTDNVTSIGFANRDIGYVTLMNGDNTFLATTDGGQNWYTKQLNNLRLLKKVYFVDANIGFMLGYGDAEARIIKTTNGGVSWDKVIPLAGYCDAYDIQFTSGKTGYTNAYGLGAVFYKTTDGGETWPQLNQGTFQFPSNKMVFLDSLNGWCSNQAAKTTDGGVTWSPCNNNLSEFNSLCFVTKKIGWVIGSVNSPDIKCKILKTTDGGANWTEQVSPVNSKLNDIHFLDSLNGWACGDNGVIIHTTNGGINWEREIINNICNLNKLYFYNSQLWVCGEQGTLFKRNIHITDVKDHLATEVSDYSLQPNYPNPFNPETIIRYALPSASNVKLTVYNSLGQKVKELVNGYQESNTYEVKFSGKDLSSGVYIYRLEAVSKDGKMNFSKTSKMLLLK